LKFFEISYKKVIKLSCIKILFVSKTSNNRRKIHLLKGEVNMKGKDKKNIKCPFCGFEGNPKDFYLMYEVVLYEKEGIVEKELRERPPLVICPKCNQGFFLKSPYERFFRPQKKDD